MEQRVLFTASTWSHIFHFHRPYLAEFRRMGWRVDVACGGRKIDIPEADRCLLVPFEKSMTAPKNIAAVQMLRREIKREGYSLVITNTALAAFFTRMAVLGMKVRPQVVNVSHGYLFDDDTSPPKRALLLGAELLVAPVTDFLLTMNLWDYEAALRYRLGKQTIAIPGMGVAPEHHAPRYDDGIALRGEFGFSEDDFLLIYAAEFSSRKNQAMLIQAMQSLPARVCLLLPGDGALRVDCVAKAKALGLEKRVIFPGQVGDMGRWYAAADCAVSSSRSEGLPFNIMEAMQRGLPIVATAVKGHADLIVDGESGLLYPYGDGGQFAAHITTLLNDPALAYRLGERARRRVQRYALPQVLPQVMAAYGEAAALPALQEM